MEENGRNFICAIGRLRRSRSVAIGWHGFKGFLSQHERSIIRFHRKCCLVKFYEMAVRLLKLNSVIVLDLANGQSISLEN